MLASTQLGTPGCAGLDETDTAETGTSWCKVYTNSLLPCFKNSLQAMKKTQQEHSVCCKIYTNPMSPC